MPYPTSPLSAENVLRDIHDPATQSIRTNTQAIVAPGMIVDISHTDDSIRIGDGVNLITSTNVDSAGRITTKMQDGAGNAITSQANGAQRALDVGINVAGVQVDPRAIRALTAADVVTANQGTSPWVTRDQADGPVTPGTAATFSQLMGGQFNTVLPTLTNTQQAA